VFVNVKTNDIFAVTMYTIITGSETWLMKCSLQGSYSSGKTGKSHGIWVVRETSGGKFLGKVRENENHWQGCGSKKKEYRYTVTCSTYLITCLDACSMASAPEQTRTMINVFVNLCWSYAWPRTDWCHHAAVCRLLSHSGQQWTGELKCWKWSAGHLPSVQDGSPLSNSMACSCKLAMALLLSHGQPPLRECFSINKELVVENQQEQSLVARRVIKDHILHVKRVMNINITCAIVLAVCSARSKYTHYLTQKKEQEEKEKQDKKQRHKLKQYKNLRTNINAWRQKSLFSNSKELYEKCENTGNLTFVTQHKGIVLQNGRQQAEAVCNAMRRYSGILCDRPSAAATIARIHNNFPGQLDLPSDPRKTSVQLDWPPLMWR